jgi:hypothetical protein
LESGERKRVMIAAKVEYSFFALKLWTSDEGWRNRSFRESVIEISSDQEDIHSGNLPFQHGLHPFLRQDISGGYCMAFEELLHPIPGLIEPFPVDVLLCAHRVIFPQRQFLP